MSSNDNNFENSLDSALNMSQDEIERLLNGQGMVDENVPEYETADLESLLSELEAMDDGDIQEISDLLDKAENNEAADAEIIDLLNMQEEIDETPAYDAMDLFSAEVGEAPKESFWKRIWAKLKKKEKKSEEEKPIEKDDEPKEKKAREKVPKEKKAKEKPQKEKKKKEKRKKDKNVESKETSSDSETEGWNAKAEWDTIDDSLNGSDAIILELEKEEVEKEATKIKEKPEKKEKAKKKDKAPKKAKNSQKGERDPEASEEDEKKKKPKKKKEKKEKEKNIVLYDMDEVPLTKKKVSLVFFVCLMLMFAIIALLVNYSGHANRRLAEEAFEEENYLECYQLLYGQHLNESQEVMFHQSKIHLKMDALWNRYESFIAQKQNLQSLDKLIQFVFEYPEINAYAAEWNCEEIADTTYEKVLEVLYEEYKLKEQDAISIANIEDDVEYTKTLTSLVEKKEKGMLKYPNMLPEEEDRIEDSADE